MSELPGEYSPLADCCFVSMLIGVQCYALASKAGERSHDLMYAMNFVFNLNNDVHVLEYDAYKSL